MKKTIPLVIAAIPAALFVSAQAPQAFKYQSIVRDNSGDQLVNQEVSFQIALLQGSASG